MGNIKFKVWALFTSVVNAVRDWNILCKGQSPEYEILQIAHRLEKGLLIKNPRKLWGWEKAIRLHYLLSRTNNTFIRNTGNSVLSSYLNYKKCSIYKEDKEEYNKFIINLKFPVLESSMGGVLKETSTYFDINELNTIRKLFYTRHSIRTFSEKNVPIDKLKEAIDLALHCPSACNRQAFKIYAVSANDKENNISRNIGIKGNMFLFITGPIDAYTLDEINDWIVSPSIFVGYLTLSLHAKGIGSCVVRKDLAYNTKYNKSIRNFCKIPKNEKLILELAIGMYEDSFLIPVSNRKSAEDCLIVCTKE